jgi:hypothetical protein
MIQYDNVLGETINKQVLIVDFIGGENDGGTIERK